MSESRRADFFLLLYGTLTLVWVLLPLADEPPKVVPTLPLFMFSPEYLFPPLVLPVRMSPMPGVEPRMIETFLMNQPLSKSWRVKQESAKHTSHSNNSN